MKVPKKFRKGYAGGGATGDDNKESAEKKKPTPVTTYSWDDYNARLSAWENPDAQNVPRDIVDYESKWIVPAIKNYQITLNAALAAKYNLPAGQAPTQDQFLTAQEAQAALGGAQQYADYLQNVSGYQAYRDKTAGTYSAPTQTAGTMDPNGEAYGYRHFGLLTLSPQQAATNVATTEAKGKPTSQAQANASATTVATGANTPATPAEQTSAPAGTEQAKPAVNATAASSATPAKTKYQKNITNFGQIYYYKDGKQISEQEYNSGVQANPDADVYLQDESKGLYDSEGNPVAAVLQPKAAKKEELPAATDVIVSGMNKGGKVVPPKIPKNKKQTLADGGPVMSAAQQEYFNGLSDEEKASFLQILQKDAGATGQGIAGALKNSIPYASLGNIGSGIVEGVVDTEGLDEKRGFFNQNANELKYAGSTALKRAGQGAALGSVIPGIGTGIGAAVGGAEGAIEGWIKGSKIADEQKRTKGVGSQKSAAEASFNEFRDGGKTGKAGKNVPYKKDGGEIKGPGTGTSDDIPADIRDGSFIVPAHNAKLAEKIRKNFLVKEDGKANLDQSGQTSDVKLSNGEHVFTPEEYKALVSQGVNVDALAPEADVKNGYGFQKGGKVGYKDGGETGGDPKKEGDILTKDEVRGETQYNTGVPSDVKYEAAFTGKSVGGKRIYRVPAADGRSYHAYLNSDGTFTVINEVQFETLSDGSSRVTNPPEGKDATQDEIAAANEAFNKRFKADYVEPEKQQSPENTGDPKIGGGPGVPAINNTGNAADSTWTSEQTKAYQDAFVKEHGGYGSGDPNSKPAEQETGKQAVASDPIVPLKAKWNELMMAGKVVEAQEVERQMKEMGYGYKYDPTTKSSDWVNMAGTSTGVSPVWNSIANTESGLDQTESGASPQLPASNVKNVFDSLGGWGALLAIGQTATGIVMSAKDKRPVDNVDTMLVQRRDRAIEEANYGFAPQEYSSAANKIETNRSSVWNTMSNYYGGNIGAGSANARLAALDSNKSALDLNAADARLKEMKQGRADQLTGVVANAYRQIYLDQKEAFMQNQAASAELINSGLTNLFGAYQTQKNQEAIDERASKYGNVFMSLDQGNFNPVQP